MFNAAPFFFPANPNGISAGVKNTRMMCETLLFTVSLHKSFALLDVFYRVLVVRSSFRLCRSNRET